MEEQQSEPSKEFALAEYHEAANAYFKGVGIGYTTVGSYIAINGLFAALLSTPGALAAGSPMVRLVPLFAIIVSIALLAALPYYFNHLENCRKRCEEIENSYGGKLFTNLGKIGNRPAFNSRHGLLVIIASIVTLWIYFATRV